MLALVLVLACNLAAALVAGPTRARRAAALLISSLSFVALLAAPPEGTLLRGAAWLGACALLMRMVDVVAEADRPAAFRVALALLVLDAREMRRAPPALDPRLVGKAAGYLLLTLAGFGLAAFVAPRLGAAAALPVRWLGGIVGFYGSLDAAEGALRACYRLAGVVARPMQDRPILSRSLGEFWGRRWNREVGGWLARWIYRPLSSRGRPALGVVAAFAWSGLFHAVATYAALGLEPALWMQGFFLVHGALALVERRLRVSRWPAWAGRTWFVGTSVLAAPLFVEPGMRILGV